MKDNHVLALSDLATIVGGVYTPKLECYADNSTSGDPDIDALVGKHVSCRDTNNPFGGRVYFDVPTAAEQRLARRGR